MNMQRKEQRTNNKDNSDERIKGQGTKNKGSRIKVQRVKVQDQITPLIPSQDYLRRWKPRFSLFRLVILSNKIFGSSISLLERNILVSLLLSNLGSQPLSPSPPTSPYFLQIQQWLLPWKVDMHEVKDLHSKATSMGALRHMSTEVHHYKDSAWRTKSTFKQLLLNSKKSTREKSPYIYK